MAMIPIDLTEDDIMDVLRFVHRVRSKKKEHDVVDKKFDKNNSSYSVNLMGRLGEATVAKYLNVPTDNSITAGGDVGHDLSFNGLRIAVKTSTLHCLIFNKEDDFSADVAILVNFVGDKVLPHVDSWYYIMGWVDRQTFIDNHYKRDYGYGIRLVMDADRLYPMEDLFNYEIPRLQ
jgi:hypothetical protein